MPLIISIRCFIRPVPYIKMANVFFCEHTSYENNTQYSWLIFILSLLIINLPPYSMKVWWCFFWRRGVLASGFCCAMPIAFTAVVVSLVGLCRCFQSRLRQRLLLRRQSGSGVRCRYAVCVARGVTIGFGHWRTLEMDNIDDRARVKSGRCRWLFYSSCQIRLRATRTLVIAAIWRPGHVN